MTRAPLAGSALAHGALLALLLLVRAPATMVLPGPDVVQVALIGEPAMPAPQPVVRPTDTVVPDESDGVRIQPERPKPRPEVKQAPNQREQTPPEAVAQPQPPVATPPSTVLPYEKVGGGAAAQVGVDSPGFEFAYYLQMVRAQVSRNWTPPAGSAPGATAEVSFRVARSGAIRDLRIATASGNALFDQTALRAIVATQQLPPLPLGWPGADLGIRFGFRYTGP